MHIRIDLYLQAFTNNLIPNQTMQASLCLPTKNHQHLALNFLQSRTIPHRLHRLNPKASLILRTNLYGGCSRRLTTLVMKAHMTPQEGRLNKARKHASARAAATAAVVLACTLGVMCTSFKARACWFGLTGSSQKQEEKPKIEDKWEKSVKSPTDDEKKKEEPTRQQKSIKVLQLIFDGLDAGKLDTLQVKKMLSKNLEDEIQRVMPNFKTDVLNIETANKESIIRYLGKWKEEKKTLENYGIGLILIDLFIIEGDYKRADEVCKTLENFGMDNDIRLTIRRAVLSLMLGDGKKETVVRTLLNAAFGAPDTTVGFKAGPAAAGFASKPPEETY